MLGHFRRIKKELREKRARQFEKARRHKLQEQELKRSLIPNDEWFVGSVCICAHWIRTSGRRPRCVFEFGIKTPQHGRFYFDQMFNSDELHELERAVREAKVYCGTVEGSSGPFRRNGKDAQTPRVRWRFQG